MSEIKCLSLWQPWASLIGEKLIETRSWATPHRGTILIHAAKKREPDCLALCRQEPFRSALLRLGIRSADELPFGYIVAQATLVNCFRITERNRPLEPERSFGDYAPGRYGWVLENVRRLRKPVPYAGAQGLFSVPAEVIAGAEWIESGVLLPPAPVELTLF